MPPSLIARAGIVPERGLNNGMPSYHAPLIASAAIRSGEYVVHVGAGTGYYTAFCVNGNPPRGRFSSWCIPYGTWQSQSAHSWTMPRKYCGLCP